MITKLTDLQKLSMDAYNKKPTGEFSVEQCNDAVRNAIIDAVGGEWNIYAYKDNKGKVFQILSEMLKLPTIENLQDKYQSLFAEVKDVALGDQPEFIITDNSLFRVASISAGNLDIRRNKIYQKRFRVDTDMFGIKVYTELDLFIAGRIDWTELVNRVNLSFANKIGTRIVDTLYNAYNGLKAPYQVSMGGTFAEDKLAEAIAHVEAKSGQKVVIYGTKKLLGKITTVDTRMSDSMKNELHNVGYFGNFQGTALVEIPQAHVNGTDDFAIKDDFLLIVPVGEKIIKVIFEGDVYVDEVTGMERNDMQMEFFFARRVGVGVLTANAYAIVRI